MYLSYAEYQSYGGDLPEAEFVLLEFQARKKIDYWTDCRVQKMETVPESVKLCMMQLIKYESKFGSDAQIDNPVVASFNTDGYSESYGSVSDQASAAAAAVIRSIKQMLYGEMDDNGVPLLYRGLDL